jgi:H+/Cl- antiporter ClcA
VEFSTTVLLKNAIAKQSEGDNDAGGMPKLWWLLLLLLLVVIAVIAWYIRRRIQKMREGTLNQV